ncbi:MAG TPA: glycosyltransferase family 87 protein [Anaerolineales bacterium]|nr:DUF2029 domain-containing protein [Anaerolineales bacterium]HNQ95438.1 glycosyltransferase family 87 protein [Anaerolineales bacterium]HNS62064.1 glycosyltransferase family 87 protein [Anaerolineales bacterium]
MAVKRALLYLLIIVILLGMMLAVALYIPSALPARSDFSALYNTTLALVNGVPIYDLDAVQAVAMRASNVPSDKFFLARFPYPPWYALSVFYLGYLPAQNAATLWFELNLVMLFTSVWLLTDGWDGRARLVAFPLGLFFLPVLGALSVGQYDFPALLGASLLIYSLRRENTALTVFGMVLLTFKPHIGTLILLAALGWLIGRRNDFGRRALRGVLIACALLCILGFLADSKWILSYPALLLNYQGEGNVASCSECASLPVFLSRWLLDGSLASAARIALGILLALIGIFIWSRNRLTKSPESVLTFGLLATLQVSPYLYNYDFLLLLIPFVVLAAGKMFFQRAVVILSYAIPTAALLILGRDGNVFLILAAMALLWGIVGRSQKFCVGCAL